jgi:hypothetical protein
MLRLKASKTIVAALVGGLALMAAGATAAEADDWHGKGWGHGKHWKKHGHGGWGHGPARHDGHYHVPPPHVHYAPPPPVYYQAPPVYYVPPPQPVYVAPVPAVSLQFRL